MNYYLITKNTVLVMSVGISCCRVYELGNTFDVNMSLKDILELSCIHYGSSFEGRLKASKYYLNYNYKLPIIIDEYKNIIVFPTKTYGDIYNSIVCVNKILDYEKKDNNVVIYLKEGTNIKINDSYKIFENQYFKALKLKMRLERIKNTSY